VLRIATRASALARWQAQEAARQVEQAHPGVGAELVAVETEGDRRLDLPVWELAGRGVFVKEVQAAVLGKRADVAVHSAKDLPSEPTPGLNLVAVLARDDPRDGLVGGRLWELPPGALVATGSVRRRAQLAWWRPDLTFTGLRGNVPTRLEKVPPAGAVVVAAAALRRLGQLERAAELLPTSVLVPQVGQGAIAVECREGDTDTAALLAGLDDPPTRRAVSAERAFLARLGGGCDRPVGAYASAGGDGRWQLEAVVASPDGRMVLRQRTEVGADPAAAGSAAAEQLLARGGADLLAEPGWENLAP
jgi:hydroxymethylbilane synthase